VERERRHLLVPPGEERICIDEERVDFALTRSREGDIDLLRGTRPDSPKTQLSSDSIDCARMDDLARLDPAHLGRIDGHNGNGIA
jgi:hypothetical protein